MKTKDLALISMFAAIISVCAWITVPGPIPFTLQTLGIFLAVLLLGGKKGSICVGIYILLGAVGLPVFSGFQGGVGVLFGVTGGYILGFLACSLTMWLVLHLAGKKTTVEILAMFCGLLVCYAFGTAWFILLYLKTKGPVSVMVVLSKCVFPFILPDTAKGALALLIAQRVRKTPQYRQLTA